MKKIFALVLVLALVFSFAACKPTDPETDDTLVYFICGNIGDKSFSDSAWVGLQALDARDGYKVELIETHEETDKFNDYCLDAIDKGADYVVGSSSYQDTFETIAPEYPNVKFILFDMDSAYVAPVKNMTAIVYKQNEGSFLVGYMAASLTKSGVVSANVGKENPVINDFVTGYIEGVKQYNAEFGTDVKVVEGVVGSWSDPATMKTLCQTQHNDDKADVFFCIAGGSGTGIYEYCSETEGTWAIGVDSDQYAYFADSENPQYAEVIVTSMLKEVGNSILAVFDTIEAGTDAAIWGSTAILGLAENAVGYVDNDNFKAHVAADVQTNMAAFASKVVDGSLVIKGYSSFASETEFKDYVTAINP